LAEDYAAAGFLDHPGLAVEEIWPVVGDTVTFPSGEQAWTDHVAKKPLGDDGVAWLVGRVSSDRFVKAELSIRGGHPLRVWVDGAQVVRRGNEDDAEPTELTLTTGTHQIVIGTVRDPDVKGPWKIRATLEGEATLEATVSPRHDLRLTDLADGEAIASVDVSPDGTHALIHRRAPTYQAKESQRWAELVTVPDFTPVERITTLDQLQWTPDSRLAWVSRAHDRATLWLRPVGGPAAEVLGGIEDFGSVLWMPDMSGLLYTVVEEPEEDGDGVLRLRGTVDRFDRPGRTTSLFQAPLGGAARLILKADSRVSILDIRPDGETALLSFSEHDTAEPPFSRTRWAELDLSTLAIADLFTDAHVGWLSYTDDAILATGGPKSFGGLGDHVEGDANDYDGQLYRYRGGRYEHLSADFAPSIERIAWSSSRGLIVKAEDGDRHGLWAVDVDDKTFTPIDTGVDAVRSFSLASKSDALAWTGSGAALPPRLMAEGPRIVEVERAYRHVGLGVVENFDARLDDGAELPGRVYLPPDYDPAKQYPTIVYYYGGTSPVSRAFGGRYPLDWWAAQGYLVYVPQPSGATGWGQDYSARHVRDWGRTSAREVIAGTRAFLDAYPAADPARIGCIGASFGGFLTMKIVTETDLFAAAVSHAGISSIASYWGEGNWGHLYNAASATDAYPWNDRDLYVGQSPLYAADAIHTPLLLLHGTADDNVPMGESEAMYTALKVLGRDVEYIRFEDQGHWIHDGDQRRIWASTIVAWFDARLKEQPSWWDSLYPDD